MGLAPGFPRRLPHGGFGGIRHADGAAEVVGVHVVVAGAFGHGEGKVRLTWFEAIDVMQKVLDDYHVTYTIRRPHQGRGMNGRTPITVFKAELPKPKPRTKEQSPQQESQNDLEA